MYKVKISTSISESAYKLACIIGTMKLHAWDESIFAYDTKTQSHTCETAYLEITKKFPTKNYIFNFIKKQNNVFYYEVDIKLKSS